MTFKSFADFKRSIAVGMRFKSENYNRPVASGERVISRVQSNALACWITGPDGARSESWCYYPKASSVRVCGERVSFLNPDGTPAFTYYDFEASAEVVTAGGAS